MPPPPSQVSGSTPEDPSWAQGQELGIMQPYLFPYLGYFQLIKASARWVVFDTAQYIRHGWVNRNRILHPSEGWQYIKAPLVKHPRHTPIKDIALADPAACHQRIAGQLEHYKKRAPFFADTMALLEECFAGDDASLTGLNVRCLELCCARLDLPFDWRLHSELDLELGPINGPGDWALEISRALGATRYVNPSGGEDLFDPAAFDAAGVELRILHPDLAAYPQGGREFEPGLSILDVFMWNSPEAVQDMLTRYELVTPG